MTSALVKTEASAKRRCDTFDHCFSLSAAQSERFDYALALESPMEEMCRTPAVWKGWIRFIGICRRGLGAPSKTSRQRTWPNFEERSEAVRNAWSTGNGAD